MDELSEVDNEGLLRAALDVVRDNFSAEHLPASIHDFLLPISAATCQGLFATTVMMASAMPALTNGASIELWSQKPSPLALLAIHAAKPQKGKSRLHNALEMLFDSCPCVGCHFHFQVSVSEIFTHCHFSFRRLPLTQEEADLCVHELAQEHGKTLKGDVEGDTTVPFSVKSVSVQSVTMSEFFFRCSTDFPQVEYGSKKEKDCVRLWFGQAWNLDEAYEMLESLSLLGCPGDRARSAAVSPHASTLNTLIQRGKTKRATRTSTTYEGNSSQHISLSILANSHPSKIIAMERGLQGQHTAATKERFLLCVDDSVARHDALPQSMLDTDPNLPKWTWLPLTPLQAAFFGWTDLLGNPNYFKDKIGAADEEPGEEGFPMALPDGVPSRVRFVAVPGGQVG